MSARSLTSTLRQRRTVAYIILAIVVLTLPFYTDPYIPIIVGHGFIWGIVGLGVNLLLGYSGLVSFGHAGIFILGAYMIGLPLRHGWGGQYFTLEAYLLLAIIVPGALCAAFSFIVARRTRVFFAILNLAFGMIIYSFFLKMWEFTHGTDGISIPTPKLLGVAFDPKVVPKIEWMTKIYYYYIIAAFVIFMVLMWVMVNSPFGKTLQAIRDNETRARFTGIRVYRYRQIAYIISAIYTAFAGCLWAPLNGHVSPDVGYWTYSGEILFLILLGGYGYFSGPIIGGMTFNALKTYAIGHTIYWMLLLGILVIILLMFIPGGLVGGGRTLYGRLTHSRSQRAGELR